MSRKLLWIWVVLAAAILGFGLTRLRLDVEILNLLPDKMPVVQGLRSYQKFFADARELIVTVRGPSAEAAATAAHLCAQALRRETNLVAQAVWQAPWMENPEHMAELIACLWLNQPPEKLAELTNRLAPGKLGAELASVREQLATSLSPVDFGRLAYDPFGFTRLPETGLGADVFYGDTQDRFTSSQGTFRLIFVEPRVKLVSYYKAAAWMTQIQRVLAQCQKASDWPSPITIRFTGGPPFLAETAASMEHDLKSSAFGTLLIIAGLFWWAHRRYWPLLCLMALLVFIVAGTMAIGGLLIGAINVVSLGFAAILMGLAVDYGLVMYQESLAAPGMTPAELRQAMAPSIVWSAVTTAAAFGLLNFGGMPGLSQLGSLVAIGVLLAAVVFLFAYLPLVQKKWSRPNSDSENSGETTKLILEQTPVQTSFAAGEKAWIAWRNRLPWLATACAGLSVTCILWGGLPGIDHGAKALQLTDCQAQVALDELKKELDRDGEPMLLVFSGPNEAALARSLATVQATLVRLQTNHDVLSFMLPTVFWPNPERQQANRIMAGQLGQKSDTLRQAALTSGFTSDAFGLAQEILRYWERTAATTNVIWPTNSSCRWLLKRFAARAEEGWLALGTFDAGPQWTPGKLGSLPAGVWLTSWSMLGEELWRHVASRVPWLMGMMIAILATCLWLAFRSWREMLLSFGTLLFSGLILLALMRVAGWNWNLMNFMALPLLLGAGVDYTIHVQLALRRHGGSAAKMRKITGRALFLCAGTTVAGFGSLGWSNSAGLGSLGLVCSTGILIVYLTSAYLLPAWWRFCRPKSSGQDLGRNSELASSAAANLPKTPSSFYQAGLWRLGLTLVRVLPEGLLKGFCVVLAELYFRVHKQRREIVVQNLLPVCQGERTAAETIARRLFHKFGCKLAELWRFESGVPVHDWLTKQEEWQGIRAIQAQGRGILFITLHLGAWEQGGSLLAQSGIKLLVLTIAEPGQELTQIRSASRAQWGIETLVIGEDSFAFIDAIKRLQDGGAVALAIDRPPSRAAVEVELFGKPFLASSAAADLARASGCALVGTTIVRTREGHLVHVLPEFAYDRKALNSREARRQLTQQIFRVFEPEIRQHLDQWYNFVPIWPKQDTP